MEIRLRSSVCLYKTCLLGLAVAVCLAQRSAAQEPKAADPELVITPNTVRIEPMENGSEGAWVELPGFSELGSPTFSKDGNWIAFDAYRLGYNNSPSECWIARRDGSALTRLAIGATPRWSPDGKRLLFMRDAANDPKHESGIFLIDRDGSHERRVCDGRWPDWSPDGRKIVFSLGGIPGGGLRVGASVYMANADGTNREELALGDCPSWSPDGKWVAYCVSEPQRIPRLRVLDLETREEYTIGYGWFRANWTPDSKALVANGIPARPGKGMVKYDVPGPGAAKGLLPEFEDPSSPCPSSDGRFMVFIAKRPNKKTTEKPD